MFTLLKDKRFFPFFTTMSLNALNDNLFKSALAILIAFNTQKESADILVQAAAGLFILPFFIFSGISGQICDRYEKSTLIRFVKTFEIVIMLAGGFGFYFGNNYFLLFVLFLMGIHSTLFGPVKYSILPQYLKSEELLAGNALTSMGTFISILAGTIIGGTLVTKTVISKYSIYPISIAILATAVFGFISSFYIPKAKPADVNLKISWNPFTETFKGMRYGFINSEVALAIFGISWFWFFGFFYMASLPGFCRDIIHGNESVATILLTMISLGMGLGSILTNKLSHGQTRLGLVILGGLGLTLFSYDLTLVKNLFDSTHPLLGLSEFWSGPIGMRVSLDFFLIGIFGGMYIVPLYTLMQEKAPLKLGSRVVASNNIWNAIFMVSAAVSAIIGFKFGLNISQIFKIVSLTNLAITLYMLIKLPEHFYFVMLTSLMNSLYRINIVGKENLPKDGPVLLVSNHVSFLDPLLIASAVNRPPRFMMDKDYYDNVMFNWFFKTSKCIPVTPKKIDPIQMEKALDQVVEGLNKGEMITIFPEGFITKDGEMIPFKNGVERIASRVDAQIVPMAIKGMWGSWFSRVKGKALKGIPPNRFRARIEVYIGPPIHSSKAKAHELYDEVAKLRGDSK